MDQKLDIVDHSCTELSTLSGLPGIPSSATGAADTLLVPNVAMSSNPKKKSCISRGPRVTIIAFSFLACFVLVLNIAATVLAVKRLGISQGLATILAGNCGDVKNLNTGIHVGINVLATALLGASNYTMQYLNAPTRTDVDNAHKKKRWLDIGIPSIRNLISISKVRACLWVLLVLSSLPLHLLYNSAVFSAFHVQQYMLTVVSQDIFTGASWSAEIANDTISELLKHPQEFSKLSPKDCISAYAIGFLTNWSNVTVVLPTQSPTNAVLYQGHNDECTPTQALANVTKWDVLGFPVSYCLGKAIEPVCELQFSLGIMILVIVCNAIKLIAIIITLWNDKSPRLVTQGDAIASFLSTKDLTTEGMCLAVKDDFSIVDWPEQPSPRKWSSTKKLWYEAASGRRWYFWAIISILALIFAVSFLGVGLQHLKSTAGNISGLASLGIGAENANTLISWTLPSQGVSGVVANTIVANLPQLIFSSIYLVYNSLFTSMLAAEEWSSFARRRRPLRVSKKAGEQQSTYMLSLPFKFALPLLVLSAAVHWLVSQSLFFVLLIIDWPYWIDASYWFATCGYSPLAIILTLAVASVLIIFILLSGRRRFQGNMPLVGSCSAAISAACHFLEKTTTDVALGPVKWGEVDSVGEIGHCSFTGNPNVHEPRNDKLYAGR